MLKNLTTTTTHTDKSNLVVISFCLQMSYTLLKGGKTSLQKVSTQINLYNPRRLRCKEKQLLIDISHLHVSSFRRLPDKMDFIRSYLFDSSRGIVHQIHLTPPLFFCQDNTHICPGGIYYIMKRIRFMYRSVNPLPDLPI